MNQAPNYYVISYDAGEALPFGMAWYNSLGNDPRGGCKVFTYFATRAECVELVGKHTQWTNPVCLCDDSAEDA